MYAVERRRLILDQARAGGRVEVNEVSEGLRVAPETVRRDLNALERQGLLRRVHGGAVPVEGLGFEGGLALRASSRADLKSRIAAAALGLLENAESVYLDEGSTVEALAEVLHPQRLLTVVTPALPVAARLAARPNMNVLLVGGRLRGHTLSAVDHWAVRMLEDLVIDLAVLGTNGVTIRHGLTCPDPAVAAVKSRAVASSRRRILLADHTKFGVDSFCRFAAVRDLDAVVADRGLSGEQASALRKAGVDEVVTA